MAAQVAAGGIANTQALDEVGIVQAPLMEVLESLAVTVDPAAESVIVFDRV